MSSSDKIKRLRSNLADELHTNKLLQKRITDLTEYWTGLINKLLAEKIELKKQIHDPATVTAVSEKMALELPKYERGKGGIIYGPSASNFYMAHNPKPHPWFDTIYTTWRTQPDDRTNFNSNQPFKPGGVTGNKVSMPGNSPDTSDMLNKFKPGGIYENTNDIKDAVDTKMHYENIELRHKVKVYAKSAMRLSFWGDQAINSVIADIDKYFDGFVIEKGIKAKPVSEIEAKADRQLNEIKPTLIKYLQVIDSAPVDYIITALENGFEDYQKNLKNMRNPQK